MRPDTRLDADLIRYINIKLTALAAPVSLATADPGFMDLVAPLLRNHAQKDRMLGWPACPVDARLQGFLDALLGPVCPEGVPRLPSKSFVLDRPGLARALSLPPTAERFTSPYLTSYRTEQGVLHNPFLQDRVIRLP